MKGDFQVMGTSNIGPREQKVIDLMNKYKARAEKKLAEVKSKYPSLYYERIKKWVDTNFSFIDEVWEIIDRDPFFKGIGKLECTLLEGRDYKYFNAKNYDAYRAPISISEFTDDVPGEPDGWITNRTAYDIEQAAHDVMDCVDSYCEKIYKRLEALQKDYREAQRTDKADAKKRDYEARRAKFYDIKIGETPALKLFLDDWKKGYIKYYQNPANIKKAKAHYEGWVEARQKYNEEHPHIRYGSAEYREEYDMYEEEKKAYAKYAPFKRDLKKLQEDADLIAIAMEADFINSVSKYCEKIKDASLHFEHGKLNGIVTGEDGKKWRVETIFAGGYAIQKLHLRTLVHEIRV